MMHAMLAVGPLVTPKFDTFYRVFNKAFENKRSSKPFGLLPFGASLALRYPCLLHTPIMSRGPFVGVLNVITRNPFVIYRI